MDYRGFLLVYKLFGKFVFNLSIKEIFGCEGSFIIWNFRIMCWVVGIRNVYGSFGFIKRNYVIVKFLDYK